MLMSDAQKFMEVQEDYPGVDTSLFSWKNCYKTVDKFRVPFWELLYEGRCVGTVGVSYTRRGRAIRPLMPDERGYSYSVGNSHYGIDPAWFEKLASKEQAQAFCITHAASQMQKALARRAQYAAQHG